MQEILDGQTLAEELGSWPPGAIMLVKETFNASGSADILIRAYPAEPGGHNPHCQTRFELLESLQGQFRDSLLGGSHTYVWIRNELSEAAQDLLATFRGWGDCVVRSRKQDGRNGTFISSTNKRADASKWTFEELAPHLTPTNGGWVVSPG